MKGKYYLVNFFQNILIKNDLNFKFIFILRNEKEIIERENSLLRVNNNRAFR